MNSLWPIHPALNSVKIRHVLESKLLFCGRSCVVFSEGIEPFPLDSGKISETCEIGGLGAHKRKPLDEHSLVLVWSVNRLGRRFLKSNR